MTTDPAADLQAEGRTTPAAGPRRPRGWAFRLARIVVLLYLGVAAIFFAWQGRLIFPGSATQGRPESVVRPPSGAELVTLATARGDRVVALFGRALGPDGSPRPDASTCPTLLYFYGNGNCLADLAGQVGDFRRSGLNVLIPDYVGYGMSGGSPGELGCRETAEAALASLEGRPDVDRGRIVVAGWSLGGAVAIDLASRHPVAGLATFCTFTSMADMAGRMIPFLPASLLLRHRFDSLAKIPNVGCPVLIGHGRRDQLIPHVMADRLAAAAEGPVDRVTIDEADHNDFFDAGGDRITGRLRRFIDRLPRRP